MNVLGSPGKPKMRNISAMRVCQQDIVKNDLHIKAFVKDIRECSGPAEVLSTLNLQVSEHTRGMKAAVDELAIIANEQDLEADRQSILREVDKYRKQMASNQAALRKANLMCQNAIDKQNKDRLFRQEGTRPRLRGRADKESLARQSSSVTDSLFTLNNMIATQVKQSEETLHTLVSSSSNVTETSEELRSMGSTIGQSRKLLHKYGRREVTDKVLITIAVLFFLSCILYVVQKRLF